MPRHRRSNDQTRRQELAAAGGSAMGHARAGVRSAYCPAAIAVFGPSAPRGQKQRGLCSLSHMNPQPTQADTKVHRLAPRSRAREEVCGVAPLSKVAEIKTTALRRPSAPTGADGQPTACR